MSELEFEIIDTVDGYDNLQDADNPPYGSMDEPTYGYYYAYCVPEKKRVSKYFKFRPPAMSAAQAHNFQHDFHRTQVRRVK